MANSPSFKPPPPVLRHAIVDFPAPHVLLIILNRPSALNSIDSKGHWELQDLLEWYDSQPALRCAVLTGRGRAFSAGADLKEWNNRNAAAEGGDRAPHFAPPGGFGAVSRRTGKKPLMLAINGIAYGGGMEMVVNADIAIAGTKATFALPEVKRGVTPIQGALPRLVRTVGKSRATEMALTGRIYTPEQVERMGIVTEVVDDRDEKEQDDPKRITDHKEIVNIVLGRKLTQRALQVAQEIAGNSPDAVIVTKAGLGMAWEGIGAEEGTRLHIEQWGRKLNAGENLREGVRAFVEKRAPRWRDSKL